MSTQDAPKTCDAHFSSPQGIAGICERPSDHPPVGVDGIGHAGHRADVLRRALADGER